MIILPNDDIIICNIYSGKIRKGILDIKNKVNNVVKSIVLRIKNQKISFKLSADYFVEFKFLIKQLKRKYKNV